MIKSQKKWIVQKNNEELVKQLQTELGISSIASKILISRGYELAHDALSILKMDDSHLHDPFLMHGMKEAVDRIKHAIEVGENICIYGDYDADGISSTTVMLRTLQDLGANVDYIIPNRFTHGYGPNEEIFRQLHEASVNLIITVDNGISGIEPIRIAKELGMDVIVTDHHEASEELPPADVIIHPRVPEGQYPFGELAGVGVAFKLAHALYGKVPVHLFEFVAIGTVADLVPLVGENRYLVQQGIKYLRKSNNPWVRAICEISGVSQHEIDEDSIGFYFGPRLNAIGRLGSASPGVDFLISDDSYSAIEGAKLLNSKNAERKEIVKTITEEAIAIIESDEIIANSQVIVIAKEGWNPGVIGIVASRLVEIYYKPTIVLSIDREKGTAKGSARSIEGFHMYNELAKNRDILPHFGGHPMAAGMTFAYEYVDELRNRLHSQAEQCLTEELLTPKLTVDVPLELSEITVEAIEEIKQLGPFGTGFSKPIYVLQDVNVRSMKKIGAAENHLKMELEDQYGLIDAVGFNKGALHEEISPGVKLSIVGDLQINEWQGKKKPQLLITDIKTDEWQLFDLRGKIQSNRWVELIVKQNVSYFAFNKETTNNLQQLISEPIHLFDNVPQIHDPSYIVLLDLPNTIEELEQLIIELRPKRIYVVFYTHNPQFFTGMPTREQFAKYYTFLKQRPSFNLHGSINQLANSSGINIELIKFMTNVFFELGFVTISNGLISVVEGAPKQTLEEATTYKQRVQQLEIEQKFLYANYQELKQWFHEKLTSEEYQYS
ncbi:single-stranded-DNA-specific exonuclease RecJ [Ureibacillus manganicus]|uniref:Single-stranded-DNA-specific exonuclease RecJ n=1 Tax=Ureibacillus manganicus DSM 26584 TaxID=1384049 RepID=A0A0A3I1M9_9BACL|nr:single-stranded-DNA-specific exonuclease RecJ [Ureibacillus manganicus]KGR78634.1 recombinase RecJ [Ureibacillus manganicus DSM 26584]